MLKRLLILPLVAVATLAAPASSHASASCDPLEYGVAATNSLVRTSWQSTCNTAWNLTIVLQYKDTAGLWHNAGCGSAQTDCRRDKPNDGSWFTADSIRGGQDDWSVTRPATICTHPFRQRFNFHFFSGAGGITFNNNPDNNPCTTGP